MLVDRKRPAAHKKSKAANAPTSATARKYKAPFKFEAQREIHQWFQRLRDGDKNLIRTEFRAMLRQNTEWVLVNGVYCLQWIDDGNHLVSGICTRTAYGGRLTFKPYGWLNHVPHLKHLAPFVTSKDKKGHEVNLATFFAILNGFDASAHRVVCSHLCHNKKCLNIQHLTWECQEANNHRNYCKIASCTHVPPCVVDGPASSYDTATAGTGFFFWEF